jgi:hypothetical protein
MLYDGDTETWSYVNGTATYDQFYTTGGGGLVTSSQKNDGLTFNGGSDFHVWHFKNGSQMPVGSTLFAAGLNPLFYCAGDWSGTKVGDCYMVQYDYASNLSRGTVLLSGIAIARAIGGTTHGTWEQYGERRQIRALTTGVGLL